MCSTKMFFVRRKAIVWPWLVNLLKTLAVESVFFTKESWYESLGSNTNSWSDHATVTQN